MNCQSHVKQENQFCISQNLSNTPKNSSILENSNKDKTLNKSKLQCATPSGASNQAEASRQHKEK